jgi:hypothetical protein
MRIIFITAFFIIGISRIAFSNTTTTIKTEYDWNQDGILDTFIFYPTNNTNIPTNFTKITIKLSGKGDFVFTGNDWVIDTIEECAAPKDLINKHNLLNSKYALLFNAKYKGKDHLLFCVFGFSPAWQPGSLTILALGNSGKPEQLINEHSDLIDILDVDNDGTYEIIIQPEREYWENYYKTFTYSTYAPYYVYAIKEKSKLDLNIKLSEQYNKKNYVGWAGLDTNHKYIIWKNPKTDKRILTTLEEAKQRYFK